MFILFVTISLLNFGLGYGLAIMLGWAKSPFGKRAATLAADAHATPATETHAPHGHGHH